MFLAVLGLSFLVTLFHELGHAFAAWSQRGTILEISVFGLTYAPVGRRFSLQALPRGGDLAGFVRFLPPAEDWTRRQYGFVAAAGPLADAVLALLALGASMWLTAPESSIRAPVAAIVASDEMQPRPVKIRSNLPSTEEHKRILAEEALRERWGDFAALPSMLMVVAFISSLGNLLPYRDSDGAQMLKLWRGRNRFPLRRR